MQVAVYRLFIKCLAKHMLGRRSSLECLSTGHSLLCSLKTIKSCQGCPDWYKPIWVLTVQWAFVCQKCISMQSLNANLCLEGELLQHLIKIVSNERRVVCQTYMLKIFYLDEKFASKYLIETRS